MHLDFQEISFYLPPYYNLNTNLASSHQQFDFI